ncbi:hypothetical protein [Pseudomonas fluorescens]|uniref:Uncharacterized protein n=1 Tax=Pseudomonas fluorescens TaxID=294 RepID=A0A5E7CRG8_PSEFL|nr:hypothetical protein [Pseudomonas fluorescens]VVO07610.1 hypothetical protein PS723_03155 [Pseudomonas fluorescens]
MSLLQRVGWRRAVFALAVTALLTVAAIQVHSSEPEIALMIGEPWEAMRQRSSATIDPAIPGHYWGRLPKSDARLRFIDPQYGFVTPLARFFTISFDDERVGNVRMSPQIEPLLLDDTLKIVLDLQEQWRQGGWRPIRVKDDPPFADTPQWRARLRDVNKGGTSYWQAGNQYQAMLVVNRFRDDKRPTEERYLIKLALARPWVKP